MYAKLNYVARDVLLMIFFFLVLFRYTRRRGENVFQFEENAIRTTVYDDTNDGNCRPDQLVLQPSFMLKPRAPVFGVLYTRNRNRVQIYLYYIYYTNKTVIRNAICQIFAPNCGLS